MQIVLAMQPDTSINPFIEHKYPTMGKQLLKCTLTKIFLMRANIVCSRSATGNLPASPVYEMLFIRTVAQPLHSEWLHHWKTLCLACRIYLLPFFWMTYCFSCTYRWFLLSFFPLDYDVSERRNMVYFLALSDCIQIFIKCIDCEKSLILAKMKEATWTHAPRETRRTRNTRRDYSQ